jgi:hypothetical protein
MKTKETGTISELNHTWRRMEILLNKNAGSV